MGLPVPGLVVARQRGQFLNGIHHGGSCCCGDEAVREAEVSYDLTIEKIGDAALVPNQLLTGE